MATDLSVIVDDNSGLFTFSASNASSPNTWTLSTLVQWYKATSWYPYSTAGTFVFPFEGTSVAFIGNTPPPPNSQMAMVKIDNGPVFSINYDDPTPPTYKQWFKSPQLAPGKHTITVSNLSETSIDFAIVKVGAQTSLTGQTIIVDNDDPAIAFSGNWTRNTNKFISGSLPIGYPYGNTTHRSSSPGSSFTFRFTGTSVSVYGIFSWFNVGSLSATYMLDGTTSPQTYTVTTSSAQYLKKDGEASNFVYYSSDKLSPGTHTLVVNITSADNQIFMLDYITYTPSFSTLSSMPILSNTTTTTTTASSSSSSASASSPIESPQAQASGSSTSQSSPTGAIIGGVIGGVLIGLLIAIIVIFLFLRRRKALRADLVSQDYYPVTPNGWSSPNYVTSPPLTSSNEMRPHRPHLPAALHESYQEPPTGAISPFHLSDSQGHYGWTDVKMGRSSSMLAQATDRDLSPSSETPSNSQSASPPSYYALSPLRPVVNIPLR